MKLLVVSDSHGRHIDEYIKREIPSMIVRTLMVPGKISEIRGQYREELMELVNFKPDIIVMHMGHNDLVAHRTHNTQPLFITAVFHLLMELKDEVHYNFPGASIFVSSILPRMPDDYAFDADRTWRYNRMARRFGQMVCSGGKRENSFYQSLPNRDLWGRITQLEAYSMRFDAGGLHLSPFGKIALVSGWADGFVVVGVEPRAN